ncbi:MAG: hypothetical protein IAB81_02690 [Bacteroidetes bacterium]|uniref:Uncharacterized protein n=1 Tax=Candidatus Merdivivens pullicola TaxID=2840872 RepID=A0A9D9NGL5_9BACT|nr:hypothetical protein [Candidatus Merdivivens pullicola]
MKEFNLKEAKAGKPVCTRDVRSGFLVVGDTCIAEKDGMLCLTDLIRALSDAGIYRVTVGKLMQRRRFRQGLSLLIGRDISHSPNIVRDLKSMGLYMAAGRRGGMRAYCSPHVFLYVLGQYSPSAMLRAAALVTDINTENQ